MEKESIIEYFSRLKLGDFSIELSREYQNLGYFHEDLNQYKSIAGVSFGKKRANGFSCGLLFPRYDTLCRESHNIGDLDFKPFSLVPKRQSEVFGFGVGEKINEHFPIEFKMEKDLERVGELLFQYYEEAKLFFEYWYDYTTLLPFIEKDTSNSIQFLGNPYILKKMTLWRLSSHPKYDEFVSERKDVLKSAIKNPPNEFEKGNYKRMLNEITLKEELLDSIVPEYNWDDQFLIVRSYPSYDPA